MSDIRRRRSKKPQRRIPRYDRNTYIRAYEMRVIDDEGNNLGVLKKEDALKAARERELDLVLINPSAKPPIAKIISWSKFKYDLSKKRKGSSSKTSEVKEMWFKPFIDTGDMDHKLKRIEEFIEKKNKVKITVRHTRGADRDKLKDTMNNIIERVSEFAEIEGDVKNEGRNLAIYIKQK